MRARLASLAAAVLVTPLWAGPAYADGDDPTIGGQATGQGIGLNGSEETPGSAGNKPAGQTSAAARRTITCDLSGAVSADCQGAVATCVRPPLPPPTTTQVIQQQQADGSWRQIGVDCDGTGPNEAIAVTAAMVRQQVVRLLPPVAVGVAPATGPTLVNLETIFWSPTPAERALGPVTILGQQVAITIRFDHATYDYGDGTTATVDTPGTPWTREACATAQCPTLDGHTYTRPAGLLTATSTITWTATFTVAGGPAQPIPGSIDGPASTHTLQVLEGRSILVR